MVRFCGSHSNAQIQTGRRGETDSTPPSRHMCEIEPHIFLPPMMIIGIDVLTIEIEYVQENLVRKMVNCQIWRPRCVLTALAGALTSQDHEFGYCKSQVDILLLIALIGGLHVVEREQLGKRLPRAGDWSRGYLTGLPNLLPYMVYGHF
jgi:hypothetical protein